MTTPHQPNLEQTPFINEPLILGSGKADEARARGVTISMEQETLSILSSAKAEAVRADAVYIKVHEEARTTTTQDQLKREGV